MNMRIIIADDEPLAVRRVLQEIGTLPGVEVAGIAVDGGEALKLVKAVRPDLLLLDIAMPEMNGIEVLEALDSKNPPCVVFISAHPNFAVEAFRGGAVDYLVKPLDGGQLRDAIARSRRTLASRSAEERIAELMAVVETLKRQQETKVKQPFEEFLWAQHRGELIRIAVASVDRFGVEGDYVIIHAGNREYLIHESLRNLEGRLDPERFARIHRSAIVRLDAVTSVRRQRFGAYSLCIGEREWVNVGRSHRHVVKRILGPGSPVAPDNGIAIPARSRKTQIGAP